KIERQWSKWSQDIIPALLQPYMMLMEETQSLRNTSHLQNSQLCKGCKNGRLIYISCVFFNKIDKLAICTCSDPALQLMSRGLFPCAPSFPTLAVDLQMLDFVQELFVNAAPNLTAWCNTLEGF
ncbi:hypothetical protein HYPSUDRAFT_105012, partial [Hypholoma sublateritium FD-334 SS-4]